MIDDKLLSQQGVFEQYLFSGSEEVQNEFSKADQHSSSGLLSYGKNPNDSTT